MTDFYRIGHDLAQRLGACITSPVVQHYTPTHRVDLAQFAYEDVLDGDEKIAWAMLSSGEIAFLGAAFDVQRIAKAAAEVDDELRSELGQVLIELGTLLALADASEDTHRAEAHLDRDRWAEAMNGGPF